MDSFSSATQVARMAEAWKRVGLPLLVSLLLLLLTLSLWQSLVDWERRKIGQAVQLQLRLVRSEVIGRLADRISAVERFARHWEHWGKPPKPVWESDAELYVTGHEGYQSIGWVDTTFHLRWIIPLKGNEPSLNLDMRFEPLRKRALERALRERVTTITGVINLVEGGRGFRAVIPLFRKGNHQGFIVSAFRSDRLFDLLLPSTLAPGYEISLMDGADEIYRRDEGETSSAWKAESSVDLYGTRWTFTLWPSEQLYASMRSYLPETILIAGVLIAILAGVLVVFVRRSWQRKQAILASRLKSEFVANMSHEIRSPLTAIIGFAEALACRDGSATTAERNDFLHRIRHNAEYLSRIIADVLDLAKIEAGKISVETEPFDLKAELRELIGFFRPQADRKGLSLSFEEESALPAIVRSDPQRMRQVLTNLVGNALKFTDVGGVRVAVSVARDGNGRRLIFRVSDTGCGISQDGQHRLFKPFGQANEEVSRRFGGSGLGLALSKRLAQQLGGDLQLATSTAGVGSTFLFSVDIGNEEEAATAIKGTRPETTRTHETEVLAGLHVLVVEDDEDIRVLLRNMLEHAGARVSTSSNGAEGVSTALEIHPDAVLMDIHMPVLNGYDATKKLRKVGFSARILALTASLMQEERARCFEAGADECLAKPFTFESLIQALRYSVRVKRFKALAPSKA